jgi:proliferating cell nuclear antigen PCNA
MIFFKAKTREGHCMKVMAELLQNNIKTAYFKVDETGISLCMMDTHRTILINMDLDANNFTVYKYKRDETMFIGINLTHFHKMLKSIKKRDSIELFIDDETPTDLGIKVIPKENNRTTTSYIKIQEIQNLKIHIPEGYGKPIIVPSGEFQKMCKGMAHIGTSILITAKAFQIQFACDAGGVMKRVTDFGEPDESDSDSDDEKDEKDKYTDEFNTDQLMRITKLAGLSQNIQIFPKEGLPLLFKSSIGMLGSISIYIKSKSLLSKESQIIEDSDDDD